MLDSFIYSLNIIAPIFIMVVLGVLMKRKKFITDGFVAICDKLVFKLSLPALLFVDIVTADAGDALDVGLIIFCVLGVTVSFVVPSLIVPIFIKDNAKRGAFIQGASIELSADAPMREPYMCYMQGGLTYSSGKTGILLAAERICAAGYGSLKE